MGYPTKRIKRAMHKRKLTLIANAALAGMKTQRHATVSRRWAGESHVAYSTTIEGVVIYRTSVAALARVFMECLNVD